MIVLRLAGRAALWLFWAPLFLAALVWLGWLMLQLAYWRTRVARHRRRRWRMAVSSAATPD